MAYNAEHGIDPQPLRKKISDVTDMLAREDADTDRLMASAGPAARQAPAAPPSGGGPATDLSGLIGRLTDEMHTAAADLQFELAARLRDEIGELKRELRAMVEAAR